MTYSRYTPGRWTAVLSEGFVVLLDPAAPDATSLGLWDAAVEGAGFVDALSVLSREGFARMPSFALAVRAPDGRTNVAVRGAVEVEAVCVDETVLVQGSGVSTWVERVLPEVRQLRFVVPGEPVAQDLPLLAGVVRAGGLRTPAGDGSETAGEVGEPRTSGRPEPVGPGAGAWGGPVASLDGTASESDGSARTGRPAEERAEEQVDEQVADRVEEPARTQVTAAVAGASSPGDPADGAGAVDAHEPDLALAGTGVGSLPTQGWTGPGIAGHAAAAPVLEPAGVGAHAQAQPDGGSGDAAFTILSSSLADLREGLPVWGGTAPVEPEPLPAPSRTTARLVLSTGLVVALDRPVLLGRAPQALRVSGRELPRLVAVPSPQQDISRTHAEVRVEGGDVLVTDLDSTNGVHVLQPGHGARRLRPSEARAVQPDETIDLGDGVTFIVERGT